ncbi:hypothetical protein [Campylobacter sp. RM16192]|uniref:hypothetical protein n=1 Tax=Campylobacter sp. RM16192 TaxID=1660080 RepID=UPI0014521279|nr:hypothetical protein [Campylobacter sp. RM16192]QCD52808.1 hypothetical protein CDOMC_1201 [Campylobacter sp. RM16192]
MDFYSVGKSLGLMGAPSYQPTFMDRLKSASNSALNWLGGSDKAGTPNILSALGTAGAIYDGYQKQKIANKALKYQKEAFDFNKMLSKRQIDRENRANQNLINAWNASNFQKSREEEQ